MSRLLPALLLTAALGCIDTGSEPPYQHPELEAFTLVSHYPADGETGVPIDAAVELTFSTMPDPDSLAPGTLMLTSGPIQFTGGYQVDLIDRRVRFRPARVLPAGLGFRVHAGAGLRALDGSALGEEQEWGFMTGDATGGAPPPIPNVTLDDLAPLLAARCAGCHTGPGAYQGLDLSSVAAARASLIGVPSVERPELNRVATGDHSRSYLMRKLLAAPRIVGDRMPPDAPLEATDLRRFADWIDGGGR